MARLGDDELVASVQRLLAQERTLSAALLMHLAEVDARGLYRQHAYSSMFDYCVQALHLFKSKRDVEALLAQHSPQPDVPSMIRKLPQLALGPERVAQTQTELSAVAPSTPSPHVLR